MQKPNHHPDFSNSLLDDTLPSAKPTFPPEIIRIAAELRPSKEENCKQLGELMTLDFTD